MDPVASGSDFVSVVTVSIVAVVVVAVFSFPFLFESIPLTALMFLFPFPVGFAFAADAPIAVKCGALTAKVVLTEGRGVIVTNFFFFCCGGITAFILLSPFLCVSPTPKEFVFVVMVDVCGRGDELANCILYP